MTDSVTLPYTYASLRLLLSHIAVDDDLRASIVLTRRLGGHTNLLTGEIKNLLVTNSLRLRYHICGFNTTQAQRNLLALRQQRYHPVALDAEAVCKLAEHIIDEYQRLIFISHANEARFMLLLASRNLQDHSTRYESLSRRSHWEHWIAVGSAPARVLLSCIKSLMWLDTLALCPYINLLKVNPAMFENKNIKHRVTKHLAMPFSHFILEKWLQSPYHKYFGISPDELKIYYVAKALAFMSKINGFFTSGTKHPNNGLMI